MMEFSFFDNVPVESYILIFSNLSSPGRDAKLNRSSMFSVFCLFHSVYSRLVFKTPPGRMATENNKPEQICVLGGGFGGLYAALRLQKMPWRGRRPVVTLVDKRDKFTFLPLLYEFASE